MKKIFVVFMSLMFIMCLGGCEEKNKIIESKMSEQLNIELEKYFKINDILKEEEVRDEMYINDLIVNYELFDKYLISVNDKYKSKYFCAYLDNQVKDILNTIEVLDPDGDLRWYIWQGENLYLKKYEYAVENEIINYNDYPLKWVEYEEKEDILNSYEDLFLISITKSQMLNIKNYENNEETEKIIIIEENSYNFGNLMEIKEGFYVLLERKEKIDLSKITSFGLYEILMHNSFIYKMIDKKIFICDNTLKQNMNYDFMDYMIIDDCYFYNLEEIIKFVKETNK